MSLRDFFAGEKFNFTNFLALVIVCFGFAYLFWSSKISVPGNNVAETRAAIITLLTLIAGYYWGSSKASAKKDETINTMQETIKKSTPTAE